MPSTNYIDGQAEICPLINDFSFLTLIASIRYVQNGQKSFCCPHVNKHHHKHFNNSTFKDKIKTVSSSNLLFLLFMKDDFDVSLLLLVFFF